MTRSRRQGGGFSCSALCVCEQRGGRAVILQRPEGPALNSLSHFLACGWDFPHQRVGVVRLICQFEQHAGSHSQCRDVHHRCRARSHRSFERLSCGCIGHVGRRVCLRHRARSRGKDDHLQTASRIVEGLDTRGAWCWAVRERIACFTPLSARRPSWRRSRRRVARRRGLLGWPNFDPMRNKQLASLLFDIPLFRTVSSAWTQLMPIACCGGPDWTFSFGICTANVEPRPTTDSTVTGKPRIFDRRRTMPSPRPKPSWFADSASALL